MLILVRTVLAAGSLALVGAAQTAPNIVFAFADDLGRYASVYRDAARPSPNDLIRTPQFDRVAREGVLFDNAFVSAPSCTPSRAAFLSGRHFFRNGSHAQLHHPWVQGHPDPWDRVTGFPLRLQEQGYHIGWSYKMHISEDRMGGKERNYVRAGRRFNGFSGRVAKASDPAAEKAALLGEVRANFRAFLADREGAQPFFYWFNPTNTHRSWARGSGKAQWGIDPDALRGKLPPFLPDDPVIREDFADYLGEAMAFDAAVGELLAELEARGELDSTVFVVSGDHGAPGFPRGKCNAYDFGARVLLAVRWPGRVAPGRRIESPVSLIDLAPTFLAAAGLAATDDMDGESLLPAMSATTTEFEAALRGWAVIGRETHVDVAREGNLPYPIRALRTRDFLYVRNFAPDRWPVATPPLAAEGRRRTDLDFGPTRTWFEQHENDPAIAEAWRLGFGRRPAEELYDLRADPHQVRDLARDPAHEATRLRLHEQLLETLVLAGDPRVLGAGDAFDRPPYAKYQTRNLS